MKLIRYILSIPLCSLVIGLIYWGFGYLLSWFIGLSTFWSLAILFSLGGVIWELFRVLSGMLMGLTSMISPNRVFSFCTVLILSVIDGIWTIYRSWTMDIHYSGKVIFVSIIFTILVLQLTFALIVGAATVMEEDY